MVHTTSGCHSGLCLLAVPKLSKSHFVQVGCFVETKKAVEDDGLVRILFEVLRLNCQALRSTIRRNGLLKFGCLARTIVEYRPAPLPCQARFLEERF